MFSVALPVLVSVTVCAALVLPTGTLPKLRLVGDRDTTGAVPTPVSDTVCGLPAALSVIVRVPLIVPDEAGENVTETVQLDPAVRLEPQVLVWP